MIEKLYGNGNYRESVPAVTDTKCNRCNGNNIYQDGYGKKHCMDCFNYGEINDSMKLYRYERDIHDKNHILKLDYDLTSKQKQGSDFLHSCYTKKKSGFLQAVCGAGKTEMTFQTIIEALNSNKKICFIVPRVSVLKEVYERFKKHYPHTEIAVLYEGHKSYDRANIIISTPQQMIYFYQEFDLIIVDEVDAFPFADNPLLQRLVKKAFKLNGVVLYLSATINKEYNKLVKKADIEYCYIPSRYHGNPLVIPEFIRIRNRKMLINEIFNLSSHNRQTLIFVPSISKGEKTLEILRTGGLNAKFISSKSHNKNEIIRSFRNKEFRILITTTVLERGVTFQDIDCVVIDSDHKVFTKSTLIQISGRVGRIRGYNNGKVSFFSTYLSKDMISAKKEIIWMNKQNEMQAL